MVLNQAGMTTVTMQDKIQNSSAVVTDPAATWHTEAGAISVGDPTFSPRTLTAQTLVTRCQASLEITQDSPDFGKQLADVMARAMAVEVDQTGLIGSGTSPEPRGIKNTSGISTVASGGVMTDFSKLLAAVKKLLDANVPVEIAALNVIMSPGIWNRLESLVTGISGDKTQLSRPKALENTKFLVTSNGLDTGSPPTSTLFLGDFRDLVLGVRAEASIEALKVTNYPGNLLIDFIGYLRCDFMVRRPTSFCTITGATPL
jgi:HK97 family phage major capsid protein